MPEAITRDNVKLVQSIYAAFARGDIESILAATDPDIAWISNADPALLPFGGERAGIQRSPVIFSRAGREYRVGFLSAP